MAIVTRGDVRGFLGRLVGRNGHHLDLYPQHEMYDLTVMVYRCVRCDGIAQVTTRPDGITLKVMPQLTQPCVPQEWQVFEFPADYTVVTA